MASFWHLARILAGSKSLVEKKIDVVGVNA
jgi:hypothetical protein